MQHTISARKFRGGTSRSTGETRPRVLFGCASEQIVIIYAFVAPACLNCLNSDTDVKFDLVSVHKSNILPYEQFAQIQIWCIMQRITVASPDDVART